MEATHDVLARLVPPGRPQPQRPATGGPFADPGMGSPPDLSGFSSEYRSSRTRANFAIGFLGVIGAVSLLTAVHYISGFGIVEDARAGVLTAAEADQFDSTTRLLAQVWLALYLGTGIAFLTWLSRAVDNVPSLTAERPVATPRWSIGWWFVPFANLFMPYQVTKDLAKRLAPAGAATWVVLAWWLAWVGSNVVALATFGVAEPQNLEELSAYLSVNAFAEVTSVAAAVLAILVTLRIQRHADTRAAQLTAMSGSDSSGIPSAPPVPPCPRCGVPRVAGERYCANCGLDLWADFDKREGHQPGQVEG